MFVSYAAVRRRATAGMISSLVEAHPHAGTLAERSTGDVSSRFWTLAYRRMFTIEECAFKDSWIGSPLPIELEANGNSMASISISKSSVIWSSNLSQSLQNHGAPLLSTQPLRAECTSIGTWAELRPGLRFVVFLVSI
ncbi:hypothetical protein OH77DRAFT_1295488 [Trametes cingulata]|nr:hypothetical protein OH77DRAFT_1295488 [Trametes cingulata]